MKCMTCGSSLRPIRSDLPFKVSQHSIVILKNLPVLQCDNCGQYSIEDPVYQRVEEILADADASAELEIIPFAA
ncbi:MAG: type II toxin-antitoxin system MqsA family antitoxin [Deltaproteobacteria bacterium]|nr:type II toxin-antitoxin system MqsA family antitoxin [Deltaproteobacteria bacterium]